MDPAENMKLLGQEIPMNGSLVKIVIVICALLAWIEYKSPGTLGYIAQEAIQGTVLNAYDAGSEKPLFSSNRKEYHFWTPGADTWKKTSREDQQKIISGQRKEWYITTDAVLAAFGRDIKASCDHVGYNRTPTWGEGTSGLKPGWMWSVDMPKDCAFDIKELTNLYKKHFHRDKKIFIEKRFIAAKY